VDTWTDGQWVLNRLRARGPEYRLFRNYYRGNHRLAFHTDQWRGEFAQVVKGLADNLCSSVVDALVDRLDITGFSGEKSGDAAGSTAGETAWDIWTENRLDRRAGEVHLEAARSGDAYILVWPKAGTSNEPQFFLNTADKVCVYYDPENPGEIAFAGKAWIDIGEQAYLTLYYPDRIEKYETIAKVKDHYLPEHFTEKTFRQRETPGETWPLANPFGKVPVFHFANNASIGEEGRSELADVIPLQDVLNKDLADRLVSQEFASFPQRWAVGLEPDYDANGNAKAPTGGPERLWFTPNTDASFGQFDAANLEGFIKVADSDRGEIARVSKTPLHYLLMSGSFPSGEALRAAEKPLMAKVEDRQSLWGQIWEEVMEFALDMAGTTGAIQTDWADTTSKSDLDVANEMLLKQQLGVPQRQLWRELGYTNEQIDQFFIWVEEDATARAAAFNAGTDTGFESPTPSVGAPVAPAPTNGTAGIAGNVLVNDLTGA